VPLEPPAEFFGGSLLGLPGDRLWSALNNEWLRLGEIPVFRHIQNIFVASSLHFCAFIMTKYFWVMSLLAPATLINYNMVALATASGSAADGQKISAFWAM
jgi:hypothetical protein